MSRLSANLATPGDRCCPYPLDSATTIPNESAWRKGGGKPFCGPLFSETMNGRKRLLV